VGQRTPEAFISTMRWAARRERMPFLEYKEGACEWIVVSIPHALHYDNGGRVYEIGCDVCMRVTDITPSGLFTVSAGILARLNNRSYNYSPHAQPNRFTAQWGTRYHSGFCGSSHIGRALTIPAMLRLAILQQSRSESHYAVTSSSDHNCGTCGEHFYSSGGDGITRSAPKRYICPACTKMPEARDHYCYRYGHMQEGNMSDCTCNATATRNGGAFGYLGGESVLVVATKGRPKK
jgi:hypothetical protein